MLKFDANLFRIATAAQSKEETRYYLNGVFVEPCKAGGVTMTATDGRRLLCIHDETGHADESAIVRLTPEAFKACKPGKDDARRTVTIDGASATIHSFGHADDAPAVPVAVSATCRVDGTFPDWRRIIPAPEMKEGATLAAMAANFNGQYLSAFAKVAGELETHIDGHASRKASIMRVVGTDSGSPALILFSANIPAFGVLMPVRGDGATAAPDWYKA